MPNYVLAYTRDTASDFFKFLKRYPETTKKERTDMLLFPLALGISGLRFTCLSIR